MPADSAPHPLAMTLYDLLAEDRDVPDLLDDLARLAADHLQRGQDVHCGIILRREKSKIVVASSSETASQMDEIQAGFEQGPCIQAMTDGAIIVVTDARAESRWPDYMEVVRGHGLASALAVPLELGELGEAAMNFYTRHPGLFDEDDVVDAQRYADLVGKALRIALRIADHADAARHRRAAMESRTAIDIAIGIIMAQNRCSQDEAFSVLQGASSHRNVKLRLLAEEVVASLGHGAPETPFDA